MSAATYPTISHLISNSIDIYSNIKSGTCFIIDYTGVPKVALLDF